MALAPNITKSIELFGGMILLFGAGLFVKENWDHYQSGSTSIIFTSENVELFENPTITICFEPMAKLSKLAKYNMTENAFINSDTRNHSVLNVKLTKPWPEIYYETSFRPGQDFILDMKFNRGGNGDREIKIDAQNKWSDLVEIEEINTLGSGLCTKVRIFENVPAIFGGTQIKLVFKDYLNESDIPQAAIYYSSEENASKNSQYK